MVDQACFCLQVFWVLVHLWPHLTPCLRVPIISCEMLFMVVRPQGYLRNQPILSKLFGLQLSRILLDLVVNFHARAQFISESRPWFWLCPLLHLKPSQPSLIIRGLKQLHWSSLILAAWNHCCAEGGGIVLQPLNINLHNEAGECLLPGQAVLIGKQKGIYT